MNLLNQTPLLRPSSPDEFGQVEGVELGNIQRITAEFLHRNWVSVPYVAHNDEIDVTEIERRRRDFNHENPKRRVSPLILLMKALCASLQSHCKFNASLAPEAARLRASCGEHLNAVDFGA